MGNLPYSHNRAVDLILHMLEAGGYLIPGEADKARLVAATDSEQDLIALATSLSYGFGSSSGASLASLTDINLFCDSDNANPTSPYTNVVRFVKGQATTPATNPDRELFTIGSPSDPQGNLQAIFGPSGDLLAPGADYPVTVVFGTNYLSAGPAASGTISASGASGLTLAGGSGLMLTTSALNNIELHAGGFTNPLQISQLFSTDNYHNWDFQCSDDTAEHTVFFSGAWPVGGSDKSLQFCISGVPGGYNRDPNQIHFPDNGGIIPGVVTYKAQCLIVAPKLGDKRMVLRTHSFDNPLPTECHLVNHHSDVNVATGTNKQRLFSVSAMNGGLVGNIFSVCADASVNAPSGYTTGPADAAECFESDHPEDFPPGTVVRINAAGELAISDSYADATVLGGVSTEPGYLLNACDELGNSVREERVAVAMAGTIPVKVSGEAGEIGVMDLLVSASGGRAAKAPPNPRPGSVIGKALEPFSGDEGTIKMLVIHR